MAPGPGLHQFPLRQSERLAEGAERYRLHQAGAAVALGRGFQGPRRDDLGAPQEALGLDGEEARQLDGVLAAAAAVAQPREQRGGERLHPRRAIGGQAFEQRPVRVGEADRQRLDQTHAHVGRFALDLLAQQGSRRLGVAAPQRRERGLARGRPMEMPLVRCQRRRNAGGGAPRRGPVPPGSIDLRRLLVGRGHPVARMHRPAPPVEEVEQ